MIDNFDPEDPENVARACIAQTQAEITADEQVTDAGVPGRLRLLAIRASESTDSKVTAIKRGPDTRIEPDGPLPAGMTSLEWQLKRLAGRLTPRDPKPVSVTREAWYFAVHGNPIEVEGFLQAEGFDDALATGPGWCRVCYC
jgi:hypothetical protein